MHYTSSEAAKTGEPFRTGSRRSGRFGRINPINEEMRTTRRTLRKGTKMKINSKDFRVRPGEKDKLRDRPTIVKPWMARGKFGRSAWRQDWSSDVCSSDLSAERNEDENQFKGFPCAARRKSQAPRSAEDCEALDGARIITTERGAGAGKTDPPP